jgi:hypothetical protein
MVIVFSSVFASSPARPSSRPCPLSGVHEVVEQVGEAVAGGLAFVAGQRSRSRDEDGGATGLPVTRISGDGDAGGEHAVHDRPPAREIHFQVVGQRPLVVHEQLDRPAAVATGVTVRCSPVAVR